MNNTAKKIMNYSIWDSVVNDKIIQLEELDRKYWSRGRKLEALTEENELLKADRERVSVQLASMRDELTEKEDQILKLNREILSLRQSIENMENSTCWKVTGPIRILADKIRKR